MSSTLTARAAPDRAFAVTIPAGSVTLDGELRLPAEPRGLVIVANGDGDHLYDRGNAIVARELAAAGFAVLTVELLTAEERAEDAETSGLRFNQVLLASRLVRVTTWTRSHWALGAVDVGYFAGGLCAGAALAAAAVLPLPRSVVCRSARIDLGVLLERVCAEVLLLTGEHDAATQRASRLALARLPESARMEVVAGARHLLDEPESLEAVVRLAEAWFGETLDDGPAIVAGGSGWQPWR